MRIVNRPQTDPHFNIAAEEYFLKKMDDDYFMLWRNQASVIIGKHQNAIGEINQNWVQKNQVPVIRRISGGGTVYHDPGNLNYTFIASGNREKLVDFKKYMQPIIEVLNELGLPAKYEGKNDIRINGLKVSGNAEHVYRNRILHHGTLLFNAQLGWLNDAIDVKVDKFSDKAVKSIRSNVANIADLMSEEISMDQFVTLILNHIYKIYPDAEPYELSQSDIETIEKLAEDKYKSWDWNFAYSPEYQYENSLIISQNHWEVRLKVKKGLIQELVLIKNDKIHPLNESISIFLVGKKHNFAEVNLILQSKSSEISPEIIEVITKLLF